MSEYMPLTWEDFERPLGSKANRLLQRAADPEEEVEHPVSRERTLHQNEPRSEQPSQRNREERGGIMHLRLGSKAESDAARAKLRAKLAHL